MQVLMAYKLYRLDESVDNVLNSEEVQTNVVKFWGKLEKMKEFQHIARLCILLLTVQPDTCDLERDFTVMNQVDIEYRANRTQENLNAAVAERDASDVCYTRFLKWKHQVKT